MPKVKTKDERAAVEWALGTVTAVIVRKKDGSEIRREEVEASLFGPLGVHKGLEDDKKLWVVTHAPTGWACAKVYTETDAMMVAECFVRLLGDALDFGTPAGAENVKRKFPWLKPWATTMLKYHKFVVPEPFMEQHAKSQVER